MHRIQSSCFVICVAFLPAQETQDGSQHMPAIKSFAVDKTSGTKRCLCDKDSMLLFVPSFSTGSDEYVLEGTIR